jgi:hypothetical protein
MAVAREGDKLVRSKEALTPNFRPRRVPRAALPNFREQHRPEPRRSGAHGTTIHLAACGAHENVDARRFTAFVSGSIAFAMIEVNEYYFLSATHFVYTIAHIMCTEVCAVAGVRIDFRFTDTTDCDIHPAISSTPGPMPYVVETGARCAGERASFQAFPLMAARGQFGQGFRNSCERALDGCSARIRIRNGLSGAQSLHGEEMASL